MENAPVIFGSDQKVDKIGQTDKDLPVPEGRSSEDGEAKGIEGGPKEENQDHDHLRSDEQIRKPGILEDTSFHDIPSKKTEPALRKDGSPPLPPVSRRKRRYWNRTRSKATYT
jgi:hypothetical protein